MSAPHAKRRTRRRNEIETRNLAPVQDAVREYRVIEDGAYAHSLQEQEIENHYSQNVNVRRTVQEDIRRAKELQDEEDRKAKIRTLDEEEEVRQIDEELAEMIQEQIFTETAQQERDKKEWENRDKELALLLEEKERRREIELARRNEDRDYHLARQMERVGVSSPESDDGKRMRVMSDEELAKRLQMEEKLKIERNEKRRKEMKSVVELQDEEYAKYIYEKDIEKAEHMFRKDKKKIKGRHRNEPLYYDDNFDPPDYHSAVHDREPEHPNGHRSRKEDRPLHKHDQGMHHHDKHRQLHGPSNHEEMHQRRSPRYDERHDRVRSHPDQSRNNDRPRNEHKPNRPPPPAFDSHHITEVKEPLDPRQYRHRERNQQPPRRSSGEEIDRSHHHEHYDNRKNHGSKRSSPRIDHELNDSRSHGSSSEKVHKSTPKQPGKSDRRRDDLQHNEDFAEIATEDTRAPNNNLSRKQRKSKSDCKQQ